MLCGGHHLRIWNYVSMYPWILTGEPMSPNTLLGNTSLSPNLSRFIMVAGSTMMPSTAPWHSCSTEPHWCLSTFLLLTVSQLCSSNHSMTPWVMTSLLIRPLKYVWLSSYNSWHFPQRAIFVPHQSFHHWFKFLILRFSLQVEVTLPSILDPIFTDFFY